MTDKIFNELMINQRKNICIEKKLIFNDFKRISKHLTTSIFDEISCSLWLDFDSDDKYINFYLNKKKYSLHRLLYYNYVDELSDSEYIKFLCKNKGKCCNINHIYINKKINKNLTQVNELDNVELEINIENNSEKLIVKF